jgi:hypothetical protein
VANIMKPNTISWRPLALIGVLVFGAISINYFFFTRAIARREMQAEQQRQAAEASIAKQAAEKLVEKKKAEAKAVQEAATDALARTQATRKKEEEDAVAEHVRLQSRYLNSAVSSKPGDATFAVAIESETGAMNPAVANALAQRFQAAGVQLLNSFFKPEFVADKYVTRIFSGETGIFEQLELTNWLSGVLIGRQTVTYKTNPALENTITATMHFQVMALPIGSTWQSQSWNLSANGAGFNESDARTQAEERIIHQIARDSTMSLSDLTKTK